MAIVNLEHIILHRTVLGPQCPACGADLHLRAPTPRPRWQRRFLFFLPRPKHHYHCSTCHESYGLMKISAP